MRIKNLTSNACNQTIICILAFIIVFTAIDFSILFIALNSGMTLWESICWMFSSFCEADLGMKFVFLVLLIIPFFFLFLLIYELKERVADEATAYDSEAFIKFIDFLEDKLVLSYLNKNSTKEIIYNDIDSLELIVDTCIALNKRVPGTYSAIQGLYININANGYSYSIHYAPVNLNKLYKIIYYSQYMKNFSYRFIGNGNHTKETLGTIIEDYIKNGYRKTFRTNLYSPVNPVILTILFVSIFGGFVLFIFGLFK